MEFPEFKSDDEMAAWFEANDVSADDLEPADDVVIASDLTASLIVTLYSSVQQNNSATGASAAASHDEANQELAPA